MTLNIPGTYLYRTRHGTPRALASYVWLEVAPWVAGLWCVVGPFALAAIPAQFAFLALYEIGYLYNDRAVTGTERSTRPSIDVGSLPRFIAVRVATLGGGALVVRASFSLTKALLFTGTALGILSLLLLHTEIGRRVARASPLRWLTFSFLAWAKYLPIVIACAPTPDVPGLLQSFFLLYGGGRVVEYAIEKHGGRVAPGALDVNTVWFVCGLPLVVTAATTAAPARAMLAAAATLGLHHGTAYLARRGRK